MCEIDGDRERGPVRLVYVKAPVSLVVARGCWTRTCGFHHPSCGVSVPNMWIGRRERKGDREGGSEWETERYRDPWGAVIQDGGTSVFE